MIVKGLRKIIKKPNFCCQGTLSISLNHCVKCLYSELFWSVFSRIRTEYGEMLRISPYSVRMRKKTDQNNSEYRYFSRSEQNMN